MPVLGFLSFTVVGFTAMFPGQVLGVECASVFAIFTSQAWNMTFNFYQSLRTVPRDLDEAARSFRLSGWQKFWRLEVPFAMPGLIWNTMMSMSGGWFFVVASEAISVGDRTVTLPGVGSYVAMAIEHRTLDERSSHRASFTHFAEELHEFMSEEAAETALRAVIAWGRYAELFAYDEQSQKFSQENPD